MENAPSNVDWSKTTDLECDACKCKYFQTVIQFKKVSKFAIGADRDQLYPLNVIRCADCGHVNEALKPVIPSQSA